ncbi:MAG: aminotransferase class IV [Chitinophagaceae bacterium]
MQANKAIVNGELVLQSSATLGINDLSIVRGYGIFDYFKTVGGRPIFWEDNLDRFYHSAQLMDLPVSYTREQLKAMIELLMAENNIPDSGIKLLLTGGYSPDGYSVAEPNLVITQHPLTRNVQAEKNGMKLISYDFHRPFGTAKSIDYVMGIQAMKKAKQVGANDVVYTYNGLVSECPRANIFFVTKDGKLITPGNDVLRGITKIHVINMVQGQYEVEDRDVTVKEMKNAAEAFITSTTKNITPILSIDDTVYGSEPGPITKQLQRQLDEVIYGG